MAYDADLRMIYRNRATEEIAQIPNETAIGKTFAEMYPHLVGSYLHQIYLQVLETGIPHSFINRWTRQTDGKTFYMDINVYPTGSGILVFSKDITERRLGELFNTAFSEINGIIHSTLDSNEILRRTVYAGAKALECDTATLSLREGNNWYIRAAYGFAEDITGKLMSESNEAHALLAIQSKQPVAVNDAQHDERFNRSYFVQSNILSVLVVPVLVRSEPIGVMFFNFGRSTVAFQQAHIDFAVRLTDSLSLALENARLYQNLKDEIDIRMQVENALRESQERFRVALSSAPLFVFSHDTELRYTWVYNAQQGFRMEHVIGKRDDEILPAAAAAELLSAKQSVLNSGQGSVREVHVPLESGEAHYLLTIEPVKDMRGSVTGLIGSAIDITEQKRLEMQQMEHVMQMEIQRRLMEQREKDRHAIARDIHDGPVQTLTSTLFNLQFTKESADDPRLREEIEGISGAVKEAVQELRNVIYELRPPSVIRFGVARAIRYHCEDLQEKHPEIQFDLHLADDGNRLSETICLTLYRIYQEAVTNVIRHSGASKVIVKFDIRDSNLTLEIHDNGRGLPNGRSVHSLTEDGHYGLAGIRERAEAIDGTLTVSSGQSKGTRIHVKVPIRQFSHL